MIISREFLTFHVHGKFYVIHKINNPKRIVRGDGGFTEGMLFVISFDQGDAIPPHPPSIRALSITTIEMDLVCVSCTFADLKA